MFVLLSKCDDKRFRVLDTIDLVIEDVYPELVVVAKSKGYTVVSDDTFDAINISGDDEIKSLFRGMGLPDRGKVATDVFTDRDLIQKVFISFGKNDNELDLVYCEWDVNKRYGYLGYKRLYLLQEITFIVTSVAVFVSDWDITLSIFIKNCYGSNIRLTRFVGFKDLERDSSNFRYKEFN